MDPPCGWDRVRLCCRFRGQRRYGQRSQTAYQGQRCIAGLLPPGPKMPESRPSARRNSKPHGPATAAASVVLHPPERIDHSPAAGGLFEAEPCHRRWSRSRSVLPPAALPASTALRRARSHSQQPERFALALGDGQRLAPGATKSDGITGAAGKVATATAFTAARSARLRSRSALRLRGDPRMPGLPADGSA